VCQERGEDGPRQPRRIPPRPDGRISTARAPYPANATDFFDEPGWQRLSQTSIGSYRAICASGQLGLLEMQTYAWAVIACSPGATYRYDGQDHPYNGMVTGREARDYSAQFTREVTGNAHSRLVGLEKRRLMTRIPAGFDPATGRQRWETRRAPASGKVGILFRLRPPGCAPTRPPRQPAELLDAIVAGLRQIHSEWIDGELTGEHLLYRTWLV
jgi:hypothetical protein